MSAATKVQLGSDEWVAAAEAILADLTQRAGATLNGMSVSVEERFTGTPEGLSGASGDRSRTWSFEIVDGVPRVSRAPRPDAMLRVTADYQRILPLARTVYTAENATQVAAYREDMANAGAYRMEGDREGAPAALGAILSELHNRLAVITA